MFDDFPKIVNQKIVLSELKDSTIDLYIKREDQLNQAVSGNKFRKLKYNIKAATKQQQQTLLTFGGAYSNHILATAVAGKLNGFSTIGVIRGDELGQNLEKTLANNPTLSKAKEVGMQFYFVSRENYRLRNESFFIAELRQKFGKFYLIPEGGTNELAVQGCEEILTAKDQKFDYICCAVGTGGTIAGLIKSVNSHQQVLGFPALKGDFLLNDIKKITSNSQHWQLCTEYHFGGYAKYNSTLIQWINNFVLQTGIPLDPIYTGKMVFGVVDLIQKGYFPTHSKILLIHTGGLQGIAGFNNKLIKKNQEPIIIL